MTLNILKMSLHRASGCKGVQSLCVQIILSRIEFYSDGPKQCCGKGAGGGWVGGNLPLRKQRRAMKFA
jgi:hypothetical protein